MRGRIPHTVRHGWLAVCALLSFAVAGQALAQTGITGTLTAPGGTSLEGARVVAVNTANNMTVQGTIDASGKFTINAPAGTYTVTVFARGLAPQTFQNVQVVEGQAVTQNVTLAAATPICIVKAAAPIPLTDDINSASFADAPDIRINSAANVVEGQEGLADFRAGQTADARFRMKYSDQALHIAGELLLAQPNVNFGSDAELWKGASLEILFQDDPFNPTRSAADPAHNFRVVVSLQEQPRVRFGANLEQAFQINNQPANIAQFVSIKNKEGGTGQLVRIDLPWAAFMTGGATPTALKAPADDALAAMDIRINTSTPGATAENPGRQFQLSLSGFGGADPRGLIPVKFCPQPPQ